METTYEMIKALPGKGTDWRALVDVLSANYVETYRAAKNAEPYAPTTTDEWAAARGIRELRFAAMCAANYAVQIHSMRSSFIPPSEETLSWGGFLGGTHCHWTDKEAQAEAAAAVRDILDRMCVTA